MLLSFSLVLLRSLPSSGYFSDGSFTFRAQCFADSGFVYGGSRVSFYFGP